MLRWKSRPVGIFGIPIAVPERARSCRRCIFSNLGASTGIAPELAPREQVGDHANSPGVPATENGNFGLDFLPESRLKKHNDRTDLKLIKGVDS